MHWFMISEIAGLVTILAATFFMRRRLPAFRRARARKQALAGTRDFSGVASLSAFQGIIEMQSRDLFKEKPETAPPHWDPSFKGS